MTDCCIEETLSCLRKPFVIKYDGTSQTEKYNTGRVGFYVERLFGINPNNSQRPDFGNCELKTIQPNKKVSIGTMSEHEFRSIYFSEVHEFKKSNPYTKMKNTLFVVYQKIRNYPDPVYQMDGWGVMNLDKMSAHVNATLQEDYSTICRQIVKCKNRDDVTAMLMRNGTLSGTYLTLSYKGQGSGGYNYPAWGFQAKFMKSLIHA